MIAPETGRYWDREGTTKTFTHPLNLDWLRRNFPPEGRILDYGCGYGRLMAQLHAEGFQNLVGVDASEGMLAKARSLHPHLSFQRVDPPTLPFASDSFDAVLLFAVLTCIPGDDDQQALVDELCRVVRSGGFLYISDYWLQTDERNRERYARAASQPHTYGVFDVSPGVAVRHHRPEWIAALLSRWQRIALADIQVTTMNGNAAAGFQWFGRKPARPATGEKLRRAT